MRAGADLIVGRREGQIALDLGDDLRRVHLRDPGGRVEGMPHHTFERGRRQPGIALPTPKYIPGRLRTDSSNRRTVMSAAL